MRTEIKLNRRRTVQQAVIGAAVLLLVGAGLLFPGAGDAADAVKVDKKFIRNYKAANDVFKKVRPVLAKKDFTRAEKILNKCLGIMPQHVKSHYALSRVLYLTGRFEPALRHIEAAKEYHLSVGRTLRGLQELNAHKNRRKKQQLLKEYDVYSNAGAVDGSCAAIPALRAVKEELQALEGKQQRSTAGLEHIPADYFYTHGNILYKLKRYPEAMRQYIRTIDADPGHGNAYNNLAGLYFMAKKYQSALRCLDQAEAQGTAVNARFKNTILKNLEASGEAAAERQGPVRAKTFALRIGDGEKSMKMNAYVLYNKDTRDAVIIDPGVRDPRIEAFIGEQKLTVKMILNTHGHWDHTGGNRYYADRYGVVTAGHEGDRGFYSGGGAEHLPERFLTHDEILNCGGLSVRVLHTPGHSPGGLCFLAGDILVSGDTLFKRTIGKTGGGTPLEAQQRMSGLIASIRSRLLTLPGHTRVLPGHGAATSVRDEARLNPFLDRETAVGLMARSLKKDPDVLAVTTAPGDPGTTGHDVDIVFARPEALASFKKSYGDYVMGLKLNLTVRRPDAAQ